MNTTPDDVPPGILLSGHLTADSIVPVWQRVTQVLASNPDRAVVVDAAGLEYADTSGIALIFHLLTTPRRRGAEIAIRNLQPKLDATSGGSTRGSRRRRTPRHCSGSPRASGWPYFSTRTRCR